MKAISYSIKTTLTVAALSILTTIVPSNVQAKSPSLEPSTNEEVLDKGCFASNLSIL